MTPEQHRELAERGSDYAASMVSVVLEALPLAADVRPERLEELYTLARRLVADEPAPVAYVATLHLALAAGGLIKPVVEIPDELTA